MSRTEISLIAVVLLVIGGAGYWYFADDIRRGIASSSFSPTMAEYLELLERMEFVGYDQDVTLSGKVVVVDVVDGGVDVVQGMLPEWIRATAPEEVELLAGVRCTEKFSGTYRNGPVATKGYTNFCEVMLVRLADGMVIANRQFSNGPPGSVSGSPAKVVGARPDEEIAAYLAALSRQ